MLFKWRRESKIRGPFPKEHFPFLLQRLDVAVKPNLPSNLISGFRTCGLYPLDRNQVLKKLPDSERTCDDRHASFTQLNNTLISLLEANRGCTATSTRKLQRGAKVVPEKQITMNNASVSSSQQNISNSGDIPVCMICGNWDDPNAAEDAEEDDWIGCDTCQKIHWYHKSCCSNPRNSCGIPI